jgi:hypothetical protein
MTGNNLHIRVFFNPFAMAEYNISLTGLADALQQAFGVTASQVITSPASEAPASSLSPPPNVRIERAAIRSMVEDFWRSFISVAVTNPQIGAQTIQNFDGRIQATASLMVPENAKLFLEAVEEERDLLFNEYKRN